MKPQIFVEAVCSQVLARVALVGCLTLAWQSIDENWTQAESGKRFNVVFILADDLGWSDTTLYNTTSLYQTPNIERLAKRGMTFTRAYSNSPLCSPTRASILTGQTPARHGSTSPGHHTKLVRLEASTQKAAKPESKSTVCVSKTRLDTAYPTLGKLIRGNGHRTAHFGKWHLGSEPYSPLQHGFEIDIPHHPGPGPPGAYVAPWNIETIQPKTNREHIEDRMARDAADWMQSVRGQPFYLNYWQFSVHGPWDAKDTLVAKYKKLVDPKNPQRCPTYAAMVESLDDAVGTLLDAVDRAGVADQTIIVFTSDNGGNMYVEVDDTVPTSNTPLRGGKATLYEGGIRVPCVVVWPGVTQPGSRSDQVVQTSDFYPTLLGGLEIELPSNHAVDAIDIMPALRGERLNREAIFTYFPHQTAVPDWLPPSVAAHSGKWKLIRIFFEGDDGAHAYRLYDLEKDIGETNNLASVHPEIVKRLDGLIENHLRDARAVLPGRNPKFDPQKYDAAKIGVAKLRPGKKRNIPGENQAVGAKSIPRSNPKPPVRPSAQVQMQRRDTNKDGFLTLEEFIGNPKGRNVPALNRQFKNRDSNKDSRLSLDELKAGLKPQ